MLRPTWLQALFTPATDRSSEQNAKVAYSDSLIAELQAADMEVVLAEGLALGDAGREQGLLQARQQIALLLARAALPGQLRIAS